VFLPQNRADWSDNTWHTDKGIKKLRTARRWALDAAIALSPLILFLPQKYSHEPLNKAWILRLSNALGSSRPSSLFDLESNIWKSVIDIVHDPQRWSNPASWFQIPPNLLHHDTSFGFFSPHKLGSPPGLISITAVQEREDLGITHEAMSTDDLKDVDQLGTCQTHLNYQDLT
jgi:hypothetical protein